MNKRNLLMCACVLAAVSFAGCNDKVNWDEKPVCGNGVIETGEICDVFVNVPCSYFDSAKQWVSGKPGCSSECKLTQGSCVASNVQNTCGNGTLDAGEACDGTSFVDPSVSCESLMGNGATGTVACVGCAVSTAGCKMPVKCGNGVVDNGEMCDTNAFGDLTCENYAGEGATGSLVCVNCSAIDSTACVSASVTPVCGNAEIEGSEQCDGSNFGGKTCADFAGVGATGALKCNECVIDSSDCEEVVVTDNCGNGEIDAEDGEECDGDNLNGATCVSVLDNEHATGSIACTKCRIDSTDCSIPAYCGDNIINGSEQCEGTNFGGKTCADYEGTGASGDLKCNANDCTIDSSDCTPAEPPKTCPNGQLDEDKNEECDGDFFMDDIKTCAAYSETYISGDLKCNDNCTIDDSLCVLKCGDGVVQSDEECDTDKFDPDMATCNDWVSGSTGTLRCSNNCEVDSSDCKIRCNDGVLAVGSEMCDGELFDMDLVDSLDCAEYDSAYVSGKLKCNASCDDVDTSACVLKPAEPKCGDNVLNGEEKCETVDGSVVYKDSATCESMLGEGYTGELSCNACSIVTTACVEPAPRCGDNKLNGTEKCERVNGEVVYLDGVSCASELGAGFTGTLDCNRSCEVLTNACVKAAVSYGKTYKLTLPSGDSTCKNGFSSTKENETVEGSVVYSLQANCKENPTMLTTDKDKAPNYIEISGFEGLGSVTFEVANYGADSKGIFNIYVDGTDTGSAIRNSDLEAGAANTLGEFEKIEFKINKETAKSVKIQATEAKQKNRIAVKTITLTAIK